MISLAGRDILHGWGKFVFTGIGLGLLIGVTLIMAGVYRGMIDDAQALLDNSGADLWVVQQDTLGPYAEPSSLPDDAYRSVRLTRGVEQAVNITYLTMQARRGSQDVRTMVVGVAPGASTQAGWAPHLVGGRPLPDRPHRAGGDGLAEPIDHRDGVGQQYRVGDLLCDGRFDDGFRDVVPLHRQGHQF